MLGMWEKKVTIRTKRERTSCFVGPLPSLRVAISLFVCFSFFGGGGKGGGEGRVVPLVKH